MATETLIIGGAESTGGTRVGPAELAVARATQAAESALLPLPRTQLLDDDYRITLARDTDTARTVITGRVTLPASHVATERRVYTTYDALTDRMFAKAEGSFSAGATPYPKVHTITWTGPPAPTYAIAGDTTGVVAAGTHEVKAELAGVGVVGYYPVAADGTWSLAHANGDEAAWTFTLRVVAGGALVLPAWNSETRDWLVSVTHQIRGSVTALDGAHPASGLAPAITALAALTTYLDNDGVLTAEVSPDPAGTSDLRTYALWDIVGAAREGALTYAAVPDRRAVMTGNQFDALRIDVVEQTTGRVWRDTVALDAFGRFAVAKPDGDRYELVLVDAATRDMLGRASMTRGLPRSFFFSEGGPELRADDVPMYGTDDEEFCYLFDAATLCNLYASRGEWDAMMRTAYAVARHALADGAGSALPFLVPQRYTVAVDPEIFRAGVVAEGAYALTRALQLFPADRQASAYWLARWEPWVTDGVEPITADLLAWLEDKRDDATNLVRDGSEGGVELTTHSTAYNVRAWFAFTAAAESWPAVAIGGLTYADIADEISAALLLYHWDDAVGKFWRGSNAAGANDATDALDANLLGALFLQGIGEDADAARALAYADAYLVDFPVPVDVQGYSIFKPGGGTQSVWTEGAALAMIATRRVSGLFPSLLYRRLAALQEPDGSFLNFQDDADPEHVVRRSLAGAVFYALTWSADAAWYGAAGIVVEDPPGEYTVARTGTPVGSLVALPGGGYEITIGDLTGTGRVFIAPGGAVTIS